MVVIALELVSLSHVLTYDDDCCCYYSWRNNVVIAFGTLLSLFLYVLQKLSYMS